MASQIAPTADSSKDTASLEKAPLHNDNVESTDISSKEADQSSVDVEKVPADEEDTSGYPTGFKLVTLIIALCLAVFLVALDQTIIATAIPKITDHFHSITDIGWYGSAYFLTSTSLQPSFGRIYTVFNVCTPSLADYGFSF